MESTSDSSTPVEQCNKCHSHISLVGHSVENAMCQRREMMTQSTITLWFPALQIFTSKKQLTKERKNITPPPPHLPQNPALCAFLNSPALLTGAGEAIRLTVLHRDSYLYDLDTGCAEQYSAIALLLKDATIYYFENQLCRWGLLTQISVLWPKGHKGPVGPFSPTPSTSESIQLLWRSLFLAGSTGAERIWAIGYMAEKAISVGCIYADLIISNPVVLEENTGSVNNCHFFSLTSVTAEEKGSESQIAENWSSWGQSGLQLSIMVNETMRVCNPGPKTIILI